MYRPKEPHDRKPQHAAPMETQAGTEDRPMASSASRPAAPRSLLDHLDDRPADNLPADAFVQRARVDAEETHHQPASPAAGPAVAASVRARPSSAAWTPPPPTPPARQERPRSEPEPKAGLEGVIQAQIASLKTIGIADILYWLRDGLKWVVALTIIGAIAAYIYSATATPRYTVYTDLIIDPQNLGVLTDDPMASAQPRDSQLLEVESTMRVLTSRNVLKDVIDKLHLTTDPEFVKPPRFAFLTNLLGGSHPSADAPDVAVMRELGDRIGATREVSSFVVTLSVWSSDPQKSMELSEAIVAAFQTEIFQSSAESAGRLAASLKSRLGDMQTSVTTAEEKVEQFKRANNIQESNTGELASSRISSALDTQVLDAQQRLIQAQSRYDQMRSAVAGRRTTTDTIFDSNGMQTLRTNYNQLQQQIGSLARIYGARYPRLIQMQSEQATIERAIADEANRILQTAKTDMDQAKASLDALRVKANAERSTVYTNNDAQVRLRELERDARAKATIYESYLQRANQITERQRIDTSNIRVISPPVPPKTKSWPPRTVLLLGGGAAGGFMLGLLLALLVGLLAHLAAARERHARLTRFA